MVTRSKNGIFKPTHVSDFATLQHKPLHIALFANKEPRGFKPAIKDPNWFYGMREEMEASSSSNTWVLVPRPIGSNIVGSKWVFRTKYLADGSVYRYKAQLVAQAFT